MYFMFVLFSLKFELTEFSFESFEASNLLFVESPAGVGWSYSNTSSDYDCGDASAGKGNRQQQFCSQFRVCLATI